MKKIERIQLTLGSLFDGSGGFPLGACMNNIVPVWASEIEPFPIRVTTKRFPYMEHYGNITQIKGSEIEPVDIISFGSPCTDLSVAGKRAGLEGDQSALFFHAVRIIKEMRVKTNGKYPRFIVWENVLGAFSSGKGWDFFSVIEEICKIKDCKVSIPMPESRKWMPAGEVVGDGFSIAYRTLDAQFWGVPQRRRRIYLVADFAGECAGKILFEFEGLSGYTPQGFCAGERNSSGSEKGIGISGTKESHGINTSGKKIYTYAFEPGAAARLGGHIWEEYTGTLRSHMGDNQLAVSIEHYPQDGRLKLSQGGGVQTICSRLGTGGNNTPIILCCTEQNKNLSPSCFALQGNMIGRAEKNGPQGNGINEGLCFTLNATDHHAIAYDCRNHKVNDTSASLQAKGNGGFSLNYINPVTYTEPFAVRRLTLSECARLQGFPPCWCEGLETALPEDDEIEWWQTVFETHRLATRRGKKAKTKSQIVKWLQSPHSDMAEYKMWGNGVALPNVCLVMAGINWLVNDFECL